MKATRLARHAALLILSLSLPFAALADDAAKPAYIRVDEDAAAARLQTALTRYQKDDVSVDLIGAIHIADKAYYQDLNRRFKAYDVLLFEMVGGEKLGRQPAPKPAAENSAISEDPPAEAAKEAAEAKPAASVSALRRIYTLTATFLGLTGQAEQIDYTQPNFVHADLTQAEFERMQKERGESLLGFVLKAAKDGQGAARQPDPGKLLKAMLSGQSNLMKLELIHTLGQGGDQIAAFAGESVILTDRNARCLEVLERELKAGSGKIGIFYGAAHFADLAKHLEDQGFKRTHQEWLTAWDIPKPEAEKQPEPAEPAAPAKLDEAA